MTDVCQFPVKSSSRIAARTPHASSRRPGCSRYSALAETAFLTDTDDPRTVAFYLTDTAGRYRATTLDLHVAAIAYAHRTVGPARSNDPPGRARGAHRRPPHPRSSCPRQ